MEGSYSTGQSPQWAVVPVEEKELLVFSEKLHISLKYTLFIRNIS
jgi:hypothetical protein